jgi:hypothetical protein
MTSNEHVARRSRLPTRASVLGNEYLGHEHLGNDYLEYDQRSEVAPKFGEYLVERGVLDRRQLLRALQLQDRVARIRVGESAAVLGYVHLLMVEVLYEQFVRAQGLDRPKRSPRRRTQPRGWPMTYAPPDCVQRARSRACPV